MKKNILIELKVVCDPPSYLYRGWRTMEQNAKTLEAWANEFNAFVRDHRSQDPVNLSVERIYQDQCEHCCSEWETDSSGCPVCCQTAVDEWKREIAKYAIT